ncbi:hypothetical protein A6F68_01226 [Tsuneonella dongtanensis]|uniref:Lipoprotein n=1 Tax=Tsuneonella dongtanensis TaxID=692370 RepID=A0A1B2AC64_9SPHN|nr:hypothetical protein [Tsuneonella dongtanensis]ANY19743.1 hypothetical protein A6F68_01226 [Tsuneonella dongtanensis]
MRRLSIIALAALAACRPPASDRYVERIALDDEASAPQVLMVSPGTEGAIWAGSGGPERIVFGHPGKAPLLALECADGGAMLKVTRFAPTEARAKGMMALIGNGHVERLKIDALAAGEKRGFFWQGRYDPADPRLDALTGVRGLELTIPGAGTLKLPGSPRPAELIERCRRLGAPEATIQPEPSPPPA